MIITTPSDEDLCVAPELAILGVLEINLVIAIKILNIAHTEIVAPGDGPYHPPPDSRVAAVLIAQASRLIGTINRYRLALVDADVS